MAREVDRLLAQLERTGRPDREPAPRPRSGPQRRITRVASGRLPSRAERAAPWARLALGVALGVAITQWPYPHGCGAGLAGYFGSVSMVVIAGVWAAASAWRQRSSEAHVLGLVLVLWGLGLGAERVLPRIGYAAQQADWTCPTS